MQHNKSLHHLHKNIILVVSFDPCIFSVLVQHQTPALSLPLFVNVSYQLVLFFTEHYLSVAYFTLTSDFAFNMHPSFIYSWRFLNFSYHPLSFVENLDQLFRIYRYPIPQTFHSLLPLCRLRCSQTAGCADLIRRQYA